MYTNRIRHASPVCRSPRLSKGDTLNASIRLPEFAPDDRLKYVESVCAALTESRFGPRGISPVVISLSDRAERRATPAYDQFDDGEIVRCCFMPLGRAGFEAVNPGYSQAGHLGRMDVGPPADNSLSALTPRYSPNLGRGSP